jgi:hypothetical protein
MPTLEVPNRYLSIAPIVVTSPSVRCGTTLVQRLLSASDNGFIYGEEIGHQLRTLTAWLFGLMRGWEQNGAAVDEDFARALAGELGDWRPGLTPPTEVMQRAWVETFYQLPKALDEHAAAIGRPVWGFKIPGYTRDMLRTLLMLLPRAKVIYVFRNPLDVVRSAKARRFTEGDQGVAALCAEWARNLREAAELGADERLLFLKYEDLVQRQEDVTRLLELFTGVEGVRRDVFDLKINTWAGEEAHGHSPTQYIAPAELTDADRSAVMQNAGDLLRHFYGGEAAA